MKDILAISTRYVSAEPSGVNEEADHVEPPVGPAFVAFTFILAAAFVAAAFEAGSSSQLSDSTAGQLGMVGTTVFALTGVLATYRAISTRSPAFAPIIVVLLGPGALWCWLVFVKGTADGRLATTLVILASAIVGVLLLVEGLWQARWLGVFCGLGAVGISLAATLVQSIPESTTTISLALLVAFAGMACLYGTLVEIESTGRRSYEKLLSAKQRIEGEITATEELLHDLRSGLLSIEAAMATMDDDVGGPIRNETRRLRRLAARGKRKPVEFDLVPGLRDMVRARRSNGTTIDLRLPTSAQVMGEESEVMAIMENLLSNAQRHGASPILVEVAEKSGAITVSVADSGKVPELDAGKFFKRGFSSHSDGDGIGLDRARTLADLNGGTVSYEPGANGETSFVFTMPSIDSARQDPEPAVAYTSAAH